MRKNAHTSPAEPDRDRDFVAGLAKGLQVLTCFGPGTARMTLSEVARLTGSTPASARRSLYTLHALGYLESDGKRFRVSPRALLLAHSYLSSRATPQLAQPLLDALSDRTRESASLGKKFREALLPALMKSADSLARRLVPD